MQHRFEHFGVKRFLCSTYLDLKKHFAHLLFLNDIVVSDLKTKTKMSFHRELKRFIITFLSIATHVTGKQFLRCFFKHWKL